MLPSVDVSFISNNSLMLGEDTSISMVNCKKVILLYSDKPVNKGSISFSPHPPNATEQLFGMKVLANHRKEDGNDNTCRVATRQDSCITG